MVSLPHAWACVVALWVGVVHLRMVMVNLRARESKMGKKKHTPRIWGRAFGMDSLNGA